MFSLLESAPRSRGSLNITWKPSQNIAPTAESLSTHSIAQPSFLDSLAAPTVFLQQALVYNACIGAGVLELAIQSVVNKCPAFAARLTEKDGKFQFSHSSTGGVCFMQGTAPGSSLQQLLKRTAATAAAAAATTESAAVDSKAGPSSSSAPLQLPALADSLFGSLPGALMPDYANKPGLALTHVALVHLADGSCVLGVRLSHLLGDWTSLRLLLRSIAAAYSQIADAMKPQQQQQQQQQQVDRLGLQAALPDLIHGPPSLNRLVLEVRQTLPATFVPVRLKPLQPEDSALFEKLGALSSSSSSKEAAGGDACLADGNSTDDPQEQSSSSNSSRSTRPTRLTYHVLPERIQQLKQEALQSVEDTGSNSNSNSNSSSRVFSSHDVLLARVLQAFGSLAGRAGVPHDVSVAVDMRARVPQPAGQEQQQELDCAVGNFFASAILEGCVVEKFSLGQLAEQVQCAIQRSCSLWLPDLAWASTAMGLTAVDLLGEEPPAAAGTNTKHEHQQQQQQQQEEEEEVQQKQQITWQRLHAMGPRKLLEQQMELGLLASLSTTQWPINFQADADMAGQLPVLAEPSFSQPQPFPLLLSQQAPAAMGGGVLLHVFLDSAEAQLLQAAIMAQGRL